MNAVLEIKNLNKQFKKSAFGLKDVSFSLPSGSIMGLVGENGAGKSTTIGCILHTLLRDSGSIKVFGEEMTDASAHLRDDIGVVFDTSHFSEYLTPKKLSNVMNQLYSRWDKELFISYLEQFKLPCKQKLNTYSRGMTMKLGLAVALAHHPRLLILDEATSGLDPIVRDEILDVFLDFVQDENHSILLSSHITSDLDKVADFVTFIHEGEIVLSESKDELTEGYGIIRCTAKQFEQLDTADVYAYRKQDYQINVLTTNKAAAAKKYKDYVIDPASIEDIMLLLVKGERHA